MDNNGKYVYCCSIIRLYLLSSLKGVPSVIIAFRNNINLEITNDNNNTIFYTIDLKEK